MASFGGSIQDRPDAISVDPVTGIERNKDVMFGPWLVQPYNEEALDECLRIWDLLVQAIEEKTPIAPCMDTEPEYGLASKKNA